MGTGSVSDLFTIEVDDAICNFVVDPRNWLDDPFFASVDGAR